jgi:hypothetical protein
VPCARLTLALTLALLVAGAAAWAQETSPPADGSSPAPEDDAPPEIISYGPKGLDIRSPDGNFHAHIDWRAQIRLTQSTLSGESIDSSPDVREGDLVVNRGRFKLGGHAYRPWLTYYFEYDFPSSRMLDLRFTLTARDALQLRVGQWKIPLNRERVDSSGKQQFAERSIVTPLFTLDRQQGALVFGRLWQGSAADSWYNVGVFSATGRGGKGSVEDPMYLGRWQWNVLGRDLGFSQCDIGLRERPAGSIAVAGATWRGPHTAFSSAGGGQLPGFEPGDRDRYDVRQGMIETAFQWRGFSWQQEYHWKSVDDTDSGVVTDLEGGYAQAGFFPHTVARWVPRPLEVAVRYAEVDPDTQRPDDLQREATLGFNWFFQGHRNKLTLDVSRLHDRSAEPGRRWETRVRLQWDVSF